MFFLVLFRRGLGLLEELLGDDDALGAGEGWAEVVGGTVHLDSNGGAGAN